MAEIKLLPRDSSLRNNQVSSKEYICKSIKEQLHELVYWQKISHPLMCVLSRPSWEAGRKCIHALYNVCAARPVLPRTVILTAQGQSLQSSDRRGT